MLEAKFRATRDGFTQYTSTLAHEITHMLPLTPLDTLLEGYKGSYADLLPNHPMQHHPWRGFPEPPSP